MTDLATGGQDGGAGADGGAGRGAGGGDAGGAGAIDPLTGQPIVQVPTGDAGGDQGGGDGGADPDWYNEISAESGQDGTPALRDWLKSAGIKDLDGLAKVARDNQKALRESGRVKIPGEGASEAEVSEWRKAIGVPDEPSGYRLPEFKDADGNPIEMNDDLLTVLADSAHKAGLPKAAYEAVGLGGVTLEEGPANITATLKTPKGEVKLQSLGI